MATFDKTSFPHCPGAKTPARTDPSETLDLEGHIPHGTPDDGLMPPSPSSENSSQDDSNDNYLHHGQSTNVHSLQKSHHGQSKTNFYQKHTSGEDHAGARPMQYTF